MFWNKKVRSTSTSSSFNKFAQHHDVLRSISLAQTKNIEKGLNEIKLSSWRFYESDGPFKDFFWFIPVEQEYIGTGADFSILSTPEIGDVWDSKKGKDVTGVIFHCSYFPYYNWQMANLSSSSECQQLANALLPHLKTSVSTLSSNSSVFSISVDSSCSYGTPYLRVSISVENPKYKSSPKLKSW